MVYGLDETRPTNPTKHRVSSLTSHPTKHGVSSPTGHSPKELAAVWAFGPS
ncbi:hypothetical protein HanXRQr2_Chr05g0212681 [Helianthus annuus]|uniref:Uncharacterized protein n=1 Tax=Helianthus annuus TaxID=4232 RepID=A0A9K3IZ87_HELAN|nr:hypothetical protein HanXRQr2_Chr05g0212681 [Helianthus annuus]KAJ0922597.1 hypothetical protein HanPSC8_Chr05g0205751 [Helianthus annuus]